MSGTTIRLYADREIDAYNFLLAFGGCGLAVLLFTGLLLDAPGDNKLSILEASPSPESYRDQRPAQPEVFRQWFGGFGGAA